jgi:hypothetical protein
MITCKLLGHKWQYKDYMYAIRATGEKYNYKAVRKCTRCGRKEFKYSTWVDEKFVAPEERNLLF